MKRRRVPEWLDFLLNHSRTWLAFVVCLGISPFFCPGILDIERMFVYNYVEFGIPLDEIGSEEADDGQTSFEEAAEYLGVPR